ncbi:hypothetical protein EB58_02773 [Enterococcus faecalis]|nr:hypothetical protein EB58_02773 [Enterococcus faecalis]
MAFLLLHNYTDFIVFSLLKKVTKQTIYKLKHKKNVIFLVQLLVLENL